METRPAERPARRVPDWDRGTPHPDSDLQLCAVCLEPTDRGRWCSDACHRADEGDPDGQD